MSTRAAITNAVSIDAMTTAGVAADWIQLFPIGLIKPMDSRKPWTIESKAHAAEIVTASLARLGGREMPIDYDHQTDFAAIKGVGGTAPAAGWIKQLEARDDGIWARVEWTPAAAQRMADREYRYISPTFFEDAKRRVALIARAALTNNPALDLAAVASGQHVAEEDSDDMLKEIALALGLPETATLEQVQAAITANVQAATSAQTAAATAAAEALAPIRTAAGLGDDADAPAICLAITNLKAGDGSDLAELRSQVVTLTTSLNTLSASTAREKAETAVGELVKAGKIVPATRETFITMAVEQPEQFAKFCSTQPVIVPPGDDPKPKIDPETITLSDDDRAICAAMDLTEEEFLAAKKEG